MYTFFETVALLGRPCYNEESFDNAIINTVLWGFKTIS